jgi:hypothetical protein
VSGNDEQLASSTQPAVQMFCALQMPAAPGQSGGPLVRHSTHVFSAGVGFVLQSGLPTARHSVLFVRLQSTHWPVTHAGFVVSGHASVAGGMPAAPLSALHGPHCPVNVLQTGLVASQAEFWSIVHCTHLFFDRSQTGVEPPHSEFDVHWTQEPKPVQAGKFGSSHELGLPLLRSPAHATHEPASLQTGLNALYPTVAGFTQVTLVRHCTHVLVLVESGPTSQNGVGGLFAFAGIGHWAGTTPLARHSTQTPATVGVASLHFGVRAAQSLSWKQPARQMWLLHVGFVGSLQSVLMLHSTQRFVPALLQTGLPTIFLQA